MEDPANHSLAEFLLASGHAVVLRLDDALVLQEIRHQSLLDEWRDDAAPLAADATLQVLLAQLLPATRASHLETQIATAITGPALPLTDLGVVPLRTPRGGGQERRIAVALLRGSIAGTALLVLRDVTPQHELQEHLAEAQSSLDIATALLRAPPEPLRLFLGSAMASVSAIRTTLRMPARNQPLLRDKLERLRVSADQLGTEARSVGMTPVALACQTLSARLTLLLQHDQVSGDAMLPLASLVDRIASTVGNVWRLEELRHVAPGTRRVTASKGAHRSRRDADWERASERRWSGFLRRHGEELGTLVRLGMEGAQLVPSSLRRNVDDMLQHLLRNAVEHGVETPEERLAADKPAAGHVTVKFEERGASGLKMTVRDDGRGFDIGRIGRAAVRCGLITEESLLERDAGDVVGLIFRAAFTTEGLDGEEGRGRGMTFLRKAVTRLGGQISVATKPGHYTQFIIQLPAAVEVHDLHAGQRASIDKA